MQIADFCLIIGTQKGGTTSLFSYLSQHPQVATSRVKETNFFLESALWKQGLNYYEGLWNWRSHEHKVALEASPNYTLSLQSAQLVAQRISTVTAGFKFIYVLRDPVEKIESMRKQGVYQGWYTPLLAKETPESLPEEVIESVRYAQIADRFVETFSKERVLLLKTSDLSAKGNPAAVMEKVCCFLDIDSNYKFSLSQIHNARNAYREDTLWHILRSSPYLSPLKGLFSDALKNRARRVLSKPSKTSDRRVSPLTQGQKAFIREALEREMRRLEKSYGLDVESWRSAYANL